MIKFLLVLLTSLLVFQEPDSADVDTVDSVMIYPSGRVQLVKNTRRPFPDAFSLLEIPRVRAQLRAKEDSVNEIIAEVKGKFRTETIFRDKAEKKTEYRILVEKRMKEALSPIDLEKIELALERRRFYSFLPAQYLEHRGESPENALAFENEIVSRRGAINDRVKRIYAESLIILFAEFPEYLRDDLKTIVMDGKNFFPSPSLLRLDLQRLLNGELEAQLPSLTTGLLRVNALSEFDLLKYTRGNRFFEFGEHLAKTGISKDHPVWKDYDFHMPLVFEMGRQLSSKKSKIGEAHGDPVKAANLRSLEDEAAKETQKIIDHLIEGLDKDELRAYQRYVVGCKMLVFGPSTLLENELAERTLNFKFEKSHRDRLKRAAPKTLEFLTKEVQQLERDILIEAATATGNLSMLDRHFKWLRNGFDTFPPIELFFAVDVGN